MKIARAVSIFLLVFLSVGAFVGSVPMLIDPTGNQFGIMPLSLLQYSPFHTYVIPGIFLLTANGLLPLYVLWRLRTRQPHYGLWVALQGGVLLGFMISECLMLRMVIWPHYMYMAIAVLLITSGLILRRQQEQQVLVTAGTQPGTRSK